MFENIAIPVEKYLPKRLSKILILLKTITR